MAKFDKYRGIFPALYAAYDENGEVCPERVQKLAKHYRDMGVKGLYVGGSSGENIYQNMEERKIVLENVMEAVGDDLTIIAHIACLSTRDSIELAKHAESLGVDAISAVPPYYFVLSDKAVVDYWGAIASSTDLDFFIYNIPGTTGYNLSREVVKELIDKHPQIVGVKNSSLPTQDIYLFSSDLGREFFVFNGPDEQLVSGLVMGAQGGIGGTYGVMPDLFMKLYDLVQDNEIEKARELQHRINDIIFKLTGQEGHMYSVIKAVLKKRGLDIGKARLPLPDVTEKDMIAVDEIIELIDKTRERYL